jgi:alpha-galactosidase
MPIEWRAEERQLHLHNGSLSLVLGVLENGALGQLHVGPPLAPGRSYRHLARRPFHGFDDRVGEPVPFALPTWGTGDFRVPAFVVEHDDGSTLVQLAYTGHRLTPGKPPIDPLPSTYVEDPGEADSVEVTLVDRPSGVEVALLLTIWRDVPVITRSMVVRNAGRSPVRATTLMSASLDLPDSDWRMVQLSGAWARERHIVDRPIARGCQSIGSRRGASSLQQNPFLALRRPATTEAHGEVLGLGLVHAGDFLAEVEVDPFDTVRIRLGIHPEGFRWTIEPGASFQVPEAVIVWTDGGLGAMSDAFHRLYRERLARGAWRDRPRPVLLNTWEATYFDFDQARILEIARSARDLGVELLVLDDGWFGERDSDDRSLGDWFADRRKLPDGIDGLARRVAELGLAFGLWIEPEMVSARSVLFREHPDWAIGVPGRPRTESRRQLVLDMGRPEVVDHLESVLSAVLSSAPIGYVKWDMNRNITEPYSAILPPQRQGESQHRYILGVYELYRRLTTRFPGILFESCASGGGRFDPAMLAFAPQGWTSDDTDAIERLRIGWGTSLAYPVSAMGAHVAAVPNHQVGRITPLATRAAVAFFGAFGYELDPLRLTDAERAEIRAQIAWFTERRELFQYGRLVRLRSPFEGDGNEMAWMTVAPDRRRAIVGWYRVLARPEPGPRMLPLRGLDPRAVYRVRVWPEDEELAGLNGVPRGGDDLMATGLILDEDRRSAAERGDFLARLLELEAVAPDRS